MNILILNTSDITGGAAVAASRLMRALENEGENVRMLTLHKRGARANVRTVHGMWLRRHFLWERFCVWAALGFRREHLFEIDIANCGVDICEHELFDWADVVHLHWINQGFISLSEIGKIARSGKKVVWTMHDLWAATSLCHYARECQNYHSQCNNCALLPSHSNCLTKSVWRRKQKAYGNGAITFVACSQWLANQARKSALLQNCRVTNIPNPISTHTFKPSDTREARKAMGIDSDKKIVLWVSQKVTDERKGLRYFVEAVRIITQNNPSLAKNMAVAILGGNAQEAAQMLDVQTFALGYVSDPAKIALTYNCANAFVLPSLEDNLPNTIMEAMACGVPCVGFNVGGIPEMIHHKTTGYVAEPRNANDLAQGIEWVLCHENPESLTQNCTDKVKREYSEHSVAERYITEYKNNG